MSTRYNIKWRDADNQEIARVVKNFNAKITRIEKNHPEMASVLPERVTVKGIKDLINTRQDLNRELNMLKRFSKRGAEQVVDVPESKYNLKTTKWQKTEMNRRAGIINRERKKRREEFMQTKAKSRGEDLGYTLGELQMGHVDQVSLQPIKAFTPSMTTSGIRIKFRTLQKESQSTYWDKANRQLVANYIKGLFNNFRFEDVKDIIDVIDKMDFKDFYKTFLAEDNDMGHLYFETQEDYEKELTALKSIWLPEGLPEESNKQPKKQSKG